MIADIFWDAATSNVALGLVAAVFVVSFMVSHTPSLILRVWPTAYLYSKAAGLVQVAAAALLCFLIGFRVADERAETKQLKNNLAFKEMQIEKAKATAEDAEKLKSEADARAAEAEGKLDEFRTKYGNKPEAVCAFTPDDLEWLRNLGRSKPR